MGIKKTTEQYLIELHEKHPNISTDDEYVKGTGNMNFYCSTHKYSWIASSNNCLKNGCPICNGHKKNTFTFKKESTQKNNKIEVIGEYVDSKTEILCRCLFCNKELYMLPTSILNGCGHKECSMKLSGDSRKRTTDEFKQELFSKYGNEYSVLGEYTKAKNKILIKHNVCNHEWNVIADQILRKQMCPVCSKVYRMSDSDYKERLKKENPTIECIGTYINSDEKIKHKCKTCNYEWDVVPGTLIGKIKRGCPMCNGGTNTVVCGINDMWTTNPELAKLLANPEDGYKYTQNSNVKVIWKCPDCGKMSQSKPIHKVKTRGLCCKICSSSRSLPNRIMYNLLTELNIKFEDEKRFDWCEFEYKNKKCHGIYDFYFIYNNTKYIIEMDGQFHKSTNNLSGMCLDEIILRDSEKDRLAKEHDITVIRINCIPSTTENIKNNIIYSNLNSIFDFSNIDWNKCFYNVATPIVKEVWNLYNNGMSLSDIQKTFNKDFSTIRKYLDYGTEIGECAYEHNNNKRKVVCLNDSHICESLNDAVRTYGGNVQDYQNCCNGKIDYVKNVFERGTNIPLIFMDYKKYINMSVLEVDAYIHLTTLKYKEIA